MWNTFKHNLFQLLLALDQLYNVVLCMFLFWNEKVYADESLSSHAYRWYMKGRRSWPMKFIDFLFYPDHCRDAYYSEINRIHLSPEQRIEGQNANND